MKWNGREWLVGLITLAGMLLAVELAFPASGSLVFERPTTLQWNEKTLRVPLHTRLVAWPPFSPYYLLKLRSGQRSSYWPNRAVDIDADKSMGSLYLFPGRSYPALSSWPDGARAAAFPGSAMMRLPSGQGSFDVRCFAGRSTVRSDATGQFQLVVEPGEVSGSLGFVGTDMDLPFFIEAAESVLQTVESGNAAAAGVQSCIRQARSQLGTLTRVMDPA